jgi:hypothetical protein
MVPNTPVIKILVLPQEKGPGGCGCCGPVGQSTEQIQALQYAIEDAFGCQVDVYDITRRGDMPNVPEIFTLMSTSGVKALPVVTLNDEIHLNWQNLAGAGHCSP